MEIAPLIYSRTGKQDYFGNFAVRPREFPINISWATKKIRSAMSDVSKVNRRVLVLSQNKVCIAGIALNMDYFVNNGMLTPEEKAVAKDYATTGDRLYAVFLGYVFRCSTGEIPVVTDSDLWQMFHDNLVPIWNDRRASAVEVDYYFECKSERAPAAKIDAPARYLGALLYDVKKFSETALLKEYLSRAQTEDVAFCSNVDNISTVKEKIFTAASISSDLFAILKREQEERDRLKREQEERDRLKREQEERDRLKREQEERDRLIYSNNRITKQNTQKKTNSIASQPRFNQGQTIHQKGTLLKIFIATVIIALIVMLGILFYLATRSETTSAAITPPLSKNCTIILSHSKTSVRKSTILVMKSTTFSTNWSVVSDAWFF